MREIYCIHFCYSYLKKNAGQSQSRLIAKQARTANRTKSTFLLTHGTDTSSGVKYFLEKGSIVVVIVVVVVVKSSQIYLNMTVI